MRSNPGFCPEDATSAAVDGDGVLWEGDDPTLARVLFVLLLRARSRLQFYLGIYSTYTQAGRLSLSLSLSLECNIGIGICFNHSRRQVGRKDTTTTILQTGNVDSN